MGWTVVYSREPGLSTQEFFEREFPNTLGGKIVACGTAPQECDSGSTFYAAVKEPDGEVWAFVALTSSAPGSYGYKEMSESMGPGEVRCPAKVLRELTPTDSEWALKWREQCWANARPKPRVREGDTVRFSEPLEFMDGTKAAELVAENPRRRVFRANGTRYRLPRSWKWDYPYEVVRGAAA